MIDRLPLGNKTAIKNFAFVNINIVFAQNEIWHILTITQKFFKKLKMANLKVITLKRTTKTLVLHLFCALKAKNTPYVSHILRNILI